MRKLSLTGLALLLAVTLLGCSNTNKAPDVSNNIRRALDQAGYKDVDVKQDRDKGVVTLSGKVPTESDKAQAESIAKTNAESQVISNEISVRPPGNESEAKAVESDLDKAIEKNVDAALIKHRMKKGISYDVNNGVVTLKGEVPSEAKRQQAEKLVAAVPNVKQVVNELEVKNQRATSS